MIWMDVDLAITVPVNVVPLIDNTDFKSIAIDIVYDQAGMALTWHFVTCAGVITATAVTPTTSGLHDWAEDLADQGTYTIEIPASTGTVNNDTEGFGWFTGVCTGVLPWAGPIIGFRAAGSNDKLIESAYSATRGFAGTAVPDAAADAAGGLPISDAGALDLDTELKTAIYHAKVDFNYDQGNTQDEYTVQWFDNSIPVTTGITLPLIQVIKRADGADLIAEVAMTQIGATAAYKYDASGAERLTLGEAAIVVVGATIDGDARTWRWIVGRDSA